MYIVYNPGLQYLLRLVIYDIILACKVVVKLHSILFGPNSHFISIIKRRGSRYSASCEFELRVEMCELRVLVCEFNSTHILRVEQCELRVSHICELNDFGFQCDLSTCVCLR